MAKWFGVFCWLALAWSSSAQGQRPNVLVVIADDLGWGDLGIYGNDLQGVTPHIDAWAAEGLRFNEAYAGGSVCSPSRATLLTGRFPPAVRIGAAFLQNPATNNERGIDPFLSLEFPVAPQYFRDAGYYTGHIGKWHLMASYEGENAPSLHEYGYSYFRTDAHNDPNRLADFMWAVPARPTSSRFLVSESIKFLETIPEGSPFFLNLWLADVHTPLAPSEEQMQAVQDCCAGGRQLSDREKVYFGTLHEMDKQFGRLIAYLKAQGLYENTIIVFSSDNGPEVSDVANAANAGVGKVGFLRGKKRSLYEGGIRVPCIASWPGHIPAGAANTLTQFHAADLWPSLAAMAGIEAPLPADLDGEDLSSALTGANILRKRSMIWEWRFSVFGDKSNQSLPLAIRKGSWKLFVDTNDPSRFELYDMERNPGERATAGLGDAITVFELYEELSAWHEGVYGLPLEEISKIAVFPSVVTEQGFRLYAPEGNYEGSLYTTSGQLAWAFQSNRAKGEGVSWVALPQQVRPGSYFLLLSEPTTGAQHYTKLVVQ